MTPVMFCFYRMSLSCDKRIREKVHDSEMHVILFSIVVLHVAIAAQGKSVQFDDSDVLMPGNA